MTFKRKALFLISGLLKKTISLFGERKASKISAHLAERLSPCVTQKTGFGPVKFFCPGELSEWRARTLLSKEPETLEWINTFDYADILWDIGANVGVYSLYAAKKGNTVLAFEPSPGNYYLLGKNIEINHLDNRISSYCIAFGEITALDIFYMGNTELGGALNSFGKAADWQGLPFVPSLKHAMIGFSIDDFIEYFKPPFPNHIKLDVDGIEDRILKGAKKTLADKRLKSVLVELDTSKKEYLTEICPLIKSFGFNLAKKGDAPGFGENKSIFANVLNHIFIRS